MMGTEEIKKISLENSLEESRKIINENFSLLGKIVGSINLYNGQFLENLQLPNDPLGNVKYVIRYDQSRQRYVIEPDSVVGSSSILDIVQKWSGSEKKNVNFIVLSTPDEYRDLDIDTKESSVVYIKETRDVIICDRNLTDFTKEGVIEDIQEFFTSKHEEFAKSIKEFDDRLKTYKMGIQKTYASLEEMQSTENPISESRKVLEDGSIVAIYDKNNPQYEHNGKLYIYSPTMATDKWIEVGKMSQSLGAQFTDEEKIKLSIIKNDGERDMFLGADGSYHRIIVPQAPVQKIFVNGEHVVPVDGTVRIDVGLGNVKAVQLNDEPEILPNDSGTLRIPVDIELDTNSLNPVSNSVVSQRIEELEKTKISSLNAELSEDGTKVILSLYDEKRGETFGAVEIPAGGGGGTGGEFQSQPKLQLTTELTKKHIRLGDTSTFSYTYDHKNVDGESTGILARIDVNIKQGSMTLFSKTYEDVSAGSYSIPLFEYLREGTIDVYVKATIQDESGAQKTKQSYQSVKVYDVKLESSYKLASSGAGYGQNDTIIIPFRVTGAGDKTVRLLADGTQLQSQNITKSGVTNGSFSIPSGSLGQGIHTMTLITDVAVPGTTIRSNSIIFQLKRGTDLYRPYALFGFSDKIGRTYESGEQIKMVVSQFEEFSMNYYSYDPVRSKSNIVLAVGDQESNIVVDRIDQTYTNRFLDRSSRNMKIKFTTETFTLPIVVEKSSMDIEKVVDSMSLELSAGGRSNTESNPATWKYRNIESTFRNINFSSGGWQDGALSLVNGASVEINYKPFEVDPTTTGKTFEFEFSTSTISDRNVPVIHSLDSGVGISITPVSAKIQTSSGTQVETKFASGKFYKIAFVLSKKTETRILEIYVDGVRCGAVQYPVTDSLLHQTPKGITIDSSSANILVRNIRIYDRALQDDEILINYIIDRPNPQDILRLYQENDVLDDSGQVSMQKLLAKGKSVMKMTADVELVNRTNNKKFEVPLQVDYFSKFGKEYSFTLNRGRLRIQGTSSTTYPRKNYRIYFDVKKKDAENTLTVGGVLKSKNIYAFKPNSPEVGLFTMKADFAESSSTHNSGLAIIINDIFKQCGFLVPPQKRDINVRIGVDGQPCDMFVDNLDGNVKYIGKYNFNNDKAKSDHVYGFDGNDCICLEFLNNSNAVGLFQTDDMARFFADGLEFRFPEDMVWEEAGDRQRHIRRLWGWIKSCVGRPDKFKREVRDYFDINFLCGWYVMTEYFMMVDQRVKNMMLATWDGNIWYFIPYDNDTVLGVRNDGKLVYDYDIDHESYDESVQHHAYAGHESELWKLVRQALQPELQETAQKIRSVMSKEFVLDVMNGEFMSNWSKRIYNKDSEYKYIKPLLEENINYLYSLQGNRQSHREYIIQNRFDLLDAKYLAGTYRADNIRVYFSHNFSEDNREIQIKASEQYNFGYGFTSGTPKQSGILANQANGYRVSLRFFVDLMMNDPQFIYGASRMQEIDFRNISKYILNNIDFSNCRSLKKLDLSCAEGNTTLQSISISACSNLEELNIQGLRSDNFTTLDLSGNTKLRKLDARRTKLQSISFASGSLLEEIYLPPTFTFLQLRGLRNLRWENIHIEDKSRITKLWIEDCDHISWEDVIAEFPNLQNIRIYGINKKGRKEFFDKYRNLGGITVEGSLRRESGFVGKYELENFLSDEDFEALQAQFPEVSISQPEYSVVAVTQSIVNDRGLRVEVLATDRLSNLDNQTGYLFGKPYEVSGHVKKIAENRRKYRSKEVERGKMVVYPLHDNHSGKYDTHEDHNLCEEADTHIAESGGIWVKEPQSWRKGVYDYETNTDYMIWSSNLDEPRRPEGKRYDFVWFRQNHVLRHYIQPKADCVGKNVSNYIYKYMRSRTDNDPHAKLVSYVKADVEGYKRVKFPIPSRGAHNEDNGSIGVYSPSTKNTLGEYWYEKPWNMGAVFTDADGIILKYLLLDVNDFASMNLDFGCKVPEGAKYLYTTIFTGVIAHEIYEIWLTNSDDVADWEPDWEKMESKWISALPLNYNRNPTSQVYPGIVNANTHEGWYSNGGGWQPQFRSDTTLNCIDNTEKLSAFMRGHGNYTTVNILDLSYLWHLAVCYYGRFDFTRVTGGSYHRHGQGGFYFFQDPRLGVRNSECKHINGQYYTDRPMYLWYDEYGEHKYSISILPQIFCYSWITGLGVNATPRITNGVICGDGALIPHILYHQADHSYYLRTIYWQENQQEYRPNGAKYASFIAYESTGHTGGDAKTMNHGKRLLLTPRGIRGGSSSSGVCFHFNNNLPLGIGTEPHGNVHYGYRTGAYVPVYTGEVTISNNIEEFKKLEHYKFLYDERFVP